MSARTHFAQCLNEINLRVPVLNKLHDRFILYGYGEIGKLIEPMLADKLLAIFDQSYESLDPSMYCRLDISNPKDITSFKSTHGIGVVVCLDRKIPHLIEHLELIFGEGNVYSFYFNFDSAVELPSFIDENKYPNIIKAEPRVFTGKKVIIVGPAPTSLEYMKTIELENFDLVVRMNKSPNFIKFSPVLGERTDYLFHCLNENPTWGGGILIPEVLKKQGVKSVIFTNMDKRVKSNLFRASLKYPNLLFQMDSGESYYEIMKNYSGKMPSTGLQAISYILSARPAELHITGFTFFSTPHMGGYHSVEHSRLMQIIEKAGNHVVSAEIKAFSLLYKKSLCSKETVVTLDPMLADLANTT